MKNCCNNECRQGRDCPNTYDIYLNGFLAVHHSSLSMLLSLITANIAGCVLLAVLLS